MTPRKPDGVHHDPDQLILNWSNPVGPPRPAGKLPPITTAQPSPPLASSLAEATLVQQLPWDFEKTFPQPTGEALDEGVLQPEDATPEGVRTIHGEHAREALATLAALDAALDFRRRGVDPNTGQIPTTVAGRDRLTQLHGKAARLEHAFEMLMDSYGSAFGAEAAEAFTKAIRAWHAGIVVVDNRKTGSPASLPLLHEVTAAPAAPIPPRSQRRSSRVIARLPVPKPLPEAIAAGRFGKEEEDGGNVRPGPHEIRAITEQHAEQLKELLHSARITHGPRLAVDRESLQEQYTAGLAAYAEDFGPKAAEQLDAYIRRNLDRER